MSAELITTIAIAVGVWITIALSLYQIWKARQVKREAEKESIKQFECSPSVWKQMRRAAKEAEYLEQGILQEGEILDYEQY